MKWSERKFDFNFPVTDYRKFIERLNATPSRLELFFSGDNREIFTSHTGSEWSAQENAGHLITVEDLFLGRLLDYENREKTLRPAQMDGKRTTEVNYNSWQIEDILRQFREKRERYTGQLRSYPPDFFARSAWHPRLQVPMRVCDMLYFQAEHDDYHLNKIAILLA